MKSTARMQARDIFIRLTDPTGKNSPVISAHRVWDSDRFIAEQHKRYDTLAKPGERLIVTMATRAEYQNERRRAA